MPARLLADTIHNQGVDRDQLSIHADRGSSMASKPVALLLADLGVTKTHSRPHCPNDNPFSEAQFKTLKYRPEFPTDSGRRSTRTDSVSDSFLGTTMTTVTPASVSTRRLTFTTGRAELVRAQRADVLAVAYAAHAERFVRKPPEPPLLPGPAWINRPER